MYQATTHGIDVTAEPFYLEDQSAQTPDAISGPTGSPSGTGPRLP